MSQLTAVTAVCTLKWLLLCSFCILLFLWESRVVLELRPFCWKNDGFFHWWQHRIPCLQDETHWRELEILWTQMMTLTWRSLWKALLSCWKLWCFEICLLLWKQNISQKPTWFLPECAPLGCLRVMRVQIHWFHVVFVSMLIGVALTVEAETRFFWCFLSLLQLSVTYHQLNGFFCTLIIPAPQSPGCWRTLPLLYTAILRWKWSSNNGKRRCRKIQEKKRGGICSAIW